MSQQPGPGGPAPPPQFGSFPGGPAPPPQFGSFPGGPDPYLLLFLQQGQAGQAQAGQMLELLQNSQAQSAQALQIVQTQQAQLQEHHRTMASIMQPFLPMVQHAATVAAAQLLPQLPQKVSFSAMAACGTLRNPSEPSASFA